MKLLVFLLFSVSLSNAIDYNRLWSDIRDVLLDENHDDGSYGPLIVRLAWHTSGTYDKNDGSGGSNGATMRFLPESEHGDNAGLQVLKPETFWNVSNETTPLYHTYGDLWTFASVVAIREMGGPDIPWAPGRIDAVDGSSCPPDKRLPNATHPPGHPSIQEIRTKFQRMGFNDGETVALIGAHSLGRMHKKWSGINGVWTHNPIRFSNDFFQHVNRRMFPANTTPLSFKNRGGDITMLPTDVALVEDPSFLSHVTNFQANRDAFFNDFAAAFSKLLHLGVPSLKPDPQSWWDNLING